MEQPKKRDMMTSALDDFWTSDYTIPKHKINTPKLKSSEDDAFDSFWERGQYTPQPKRYVADVKPINYKNPVKYQPGVINARSQLAQLQAEYERKRVEDKIAEINAKRMQNNIRTAQQIGGAAINTSKTIYSKGAPVVKKGIANVTEFAKKYLSSAKVVAPVDTKEPVGLGGAIYAANKAAGKRPIYD